SRPVGEEACGAGKDIRRVSDVPVQPAKAAARATSSARLANPDLSVPIPALRILLDPFDLLRGHGIDDRAEQPRTRIGRPSNPLRVDARYDVSRRWRLRIVTVKSRVKRRPKFKYIVALLSRTDNTLPLPVQNWPRAAAIRLRCSGRKGAKLGSAQRPRRAARATRSERSRISAKALSPQRPAPGPARPVFPGSTVDSHRHERTNATTRAPRLLS